MGDYIATSTKEQQAKERWQVVDGKVDDDGDGSNVAVRRRFKP